MATIRESIVQAFQAVRATFEEKDVRALEAKVMAATPSKPTDYAFVIARNWAIGRHRKARTEAARILREEHAAAEARRSAEIGREAREEFSALYRRMVLEATPTRIRQLQIVSLVCFERLGDQETAARFPGTTSSARWQWKKRAVDLLWPHASAALREVLSRGTRQRR